MKQFALILGIALAFPFIGHSTTWYVNNQSTCGGSITQSSCPTAYICPSGCGLTWATALPNLHCALTAALPGDEIWVAASPNPYIPILYQNCLATSAALVEYARFNLKDGVAVYGGFKGNETLLSQRDWIQNETIISGDRGVVGDPTDNINNVIGAHFTGPGTIIDGFTVTGGDGSSGVNFSYNGGAGMSVSDAEIEIRNMNFIYNSTGFGPGYKHGGGAIMIRNNSVVTIDACRFEENIAVEGGAIVVETSSQALIVNSLFFDNKALLGGAINSWNNGTGTTVVNCTFVDNVCYNDGGGAMLNMHGSTPKVDGSIFYGNSSLDGTEIGHFAGTYYPTLDYLSVLTPLAPSNISVDFSITQFWNVGTGLQVGVNPGFKGSTLPAGSDGYFGTNDDHFIATNPTVVNTGNTPAIVATGVTVDVSQSPRVMGGGVDLGIYEVGAIITIPKRGFDNFGAEDGAQYWTVYPNPSSGTFFLQGDVAVDQLTVIDPLGRQIDVKTVETASGQIEVDLTGLSQGTYYLQVSIDGVPTVQPVVLK